MASAAWKQREIQQREKTIIEVARKLLLKQGYFALTMDRLVAHTEYSKGTLYQHFSSKEDVLAAIEAEADVVRSSFFDRAAKFRGNARERMTCLGYAYELYFTLYPGHFNSERIIEAPEVQEKISPKRRFNAKSQDEHCFKVMLEMIFSAEIEGNLRLPKGMTAQALCFNLWSATSGAYSKLAAHFELPNMTQKELLLSVRRNTWHLLDGYRWHPLSSEVDYEKIIKRARREIFPQEVPSR
jgi:AcrR family transcriptional regulator